MNKGDEWSFLAKVQGGLSRRKPSVMQPVADVCSWKNLWKWGSKLAALAGSDTHFKTHGHVKRVRHTRANTQRPHSRCSCQKSVGYPAELSATCQKTAAHIRSSEILTPASKTCDWNTTLIINCLSNRGCPLGLPLFYIKTVCLHDWAGAQFLQQIFFKHNSKFIVQAFPIRTLDERTCVMWPKTLCSIFFKAGTHYMTFAQILRWVHNSWVRASLQILANRSW